MLTNFEQVSYFSSLGKTLGRKKQCKPLFEKKIQEPRIGSGTSHFQ